MYIYVYIKYNYLTMLASTTMHFLIPEANSSECMALFFFLTFLTCQRLTVVVCYKITHTHITPKKWDYLKFTYGVMKILALILLASACR